VIVYGDREDPFGVGLTYDILLQFYQNFMRGEQGYRAAGKWLSDGRDGLTDQNFLAEVDALIANEYILWPRDQALDFALRSIAE
jgi:hypothetical protein